jgi:hypothetical protein
VQTQVKVAQTQQAALAETLTAQMTMPEPTPRAVVVILMLAAVVVAQDITVVVAAAQVAVVAVAQVISMRQ